MFRTGDYGRLVNGQLYFEGRADSQIKIRGHRVDLNEVSHAINDLEEVSFGGVLCYKAGEPEQVMISLIITKEFVLITKSIFRKLLLLSFLKKERVSKSSGNI